MADAIIKTVARLYLKNPDYNTRSAFHTAMTGEPGNPTKIHTLVFRNGIAYDTPETIARMFIDCGVAMVDPPVVQTSRFS